MISKIESREISGTPKDMGPPYGKRDPYHEPISLGIRKWEWYGNSMGPAYHKGVPLLGVPENPTD